MPFHKIFLIFVFFSLFSATPSYAENLSFTGEVEKKFIGSIKKIFSLNREIQRNPKSRFIEEVYKKRNTYTRYAESLVQHMEMNSGLIPTLDVSKRYKLSLQKYLLSCEIAALRMVIEAVSGTYISEEAIMREIPHFNSPLTEGVWGDPEVEFVGSYTGSQAKATGYGVYGFPLARYLDKKGYSNEYRNSLIGIKTSSDKEMVYALESLEKGKHVILWGDWCTTPSLDDGIVDKVDTYIVRTFGIASRNICERNSETRKMQWRTKENKAINGISGEHAFLLLGYVGNREDPTHIIVWDTDTGRHIYPILEWMRKWSLLDYRMLIVDDNSNSGNKK